MVLGSQGPCFAACTDGGDREDAHVGGIATGADRPGYLFYKSIE
jgi:hypothetical protein